MRISDWSSDVCSSDLTGFLDFPITRRAAGAMVVGAEGEDALQNGAGLRQRQIAIHAVVIHASHRHRLEQSQVKALLPAPAGHADQFLVADSFQRQHVSLAVKTGGLCRYHAPQHLLPFSTSRATGT